MKTDVKLVGPRYYMELLITDVVCRGTCQVSNTYGAWTGSWADWRTVLRLW